MINEESAFFSRDITRGSHDLQSVAERVDGYYKDGNIELVSRVFHGIPSKNSMVSFNTASTDNGQLVPSNVLHLGSYNYAGLNGHPEIIEAALNATNRYGTTTSGVRLLNGTCDLHLELERSLAKFLGVEEVVTFSSGFVANLAAISSITTEGDLILSDMLNHQSIVDGIKLSGAECLIYRHCSPKSIEAILRRQPISRRKFIITDGVFSMDGNLAPIPEIVALAQKYNAFVIVDDAHGTASVGPHGRGTCEHFGITSEVDVITGSLSKGLPGVGGFVATTKQIAGIIRASSNPYIFSASIPPAIAAGIIAAISVLESDGGIVERLEGNSRWLREKLRDAGFNLLKSETAIIPILMPTQEVTYEITRMLQTRGVYVNPVSYPAVSKSRTRIRLNVSADLDQHELGFGFEEICRAGRDLKVIS